MNRLHRYAVLGLCTLWVAGCSTRTYDLVIANGRIMDPESGFDRVAHVAEPVKGPVGVVVMNLHGSTS